MLNLRFACVVLMVATVAGAQAPPDRTAKVSFEVASIKPSDPNGGRGHSNFPLTPGDRYAPNSGYFSASGMTVLRYIAFAYSLDNNPDVQLNALPGWAKNERYDIEARAAGPATKDDMRAMMRSLLADRFKLATHYEVRNIPVYFLTMVKPGKFGPQMRPHSEADAPCSDFLSTRGAPVAAVAATAAGSGAVAGTGGAPAGGGANASTSADASAGGRGSGQRVTPDGYPMQCGDYTGLPGAPPGRSRLGGRNDSWEDFMAMLRGGFDRYVVDETGLSGRFDWWMEYVQDPATDGPQVLNNPDRYFDPTGPKLWTAFPEQLGLILKPAKADVKLLIFDHVEKPTPN